MRQGLGHEKRALWAPLKGSSEARQNRSDLSRVEGTTDCERHCHAPPPVHSLQHQRSQHFHRRVYPPWLAPRLSSARRFRRGPAVSASARCLGPTAHPPEPKGWTGDQFRVLTQSLHEAPVWSGDGQRRARRRSVVRWPALTGRLVWRSLQGDRLPEVPAATAGTLKRRLVRPCSQGATSDLRWFVGIRSISQGGGGRPRACPTIHGSSYVRRQRSLERLPLS